MSILKSKHNGWLADGTRTPFTGGGGGGPSQTTTQTSNIPDYARPYVENMLGSTQAQLFKTNNVGGFDNEGNPTSRTEITGFKPYQAYSSNVNDYFAGPSPLQQQSYQGMANMQVAPQVGEGSVMANQAGAGLMGTAMPAMGMSGMAAGAGQAYENQATNAGDVSRYMSPYMQNVVDYQKSQALRDFQMGQPMMQAKAVGQGAFGGNRMALQQAEAQRGLMSQLQGIQATGTQQAFDKAQAAQQYRANLGLQGLQTGLQGINTAQAGLTGGVNAANTLGSLGQNQYGQQMGILEGQNRFGTQQQQMEQAKINQGISDYATAQQYPMLQLGFMSNMLRGLPMQAQTTQMYQAQPSTLQQGIGLLGAGASLYGAQGRKEGGVIGYRYGGAISGPKLESMADKLTPVQLEAKLKDRELDKGERQIFEDAFNDKAKDKARYSGIAAAGGGLFESQGYAGGGILAFADEGLVPSPEESVGQTSGPGYGKTVSSFGDILGMLGTEHEWQKADRLKRHGVEYNPPEGYDKRGVPIKKEAAAKETAKEEVKTQAPSAGPSAGAAPSQAYGAPTGGGVGTGPGSTLGGILADIRKQGPQGELGADALKTIEENMAGADKRMSKAEKLAMAKGFIKLGTTAAPGGIGQAALLGLGEYTEGYGKAVESDEKYKAELSKQKSDILALRRAEERGDVKLAAELQDKIADRDNRLKAAQIGASAGNAAINLKKEERAAIKADLTKKYGREPTMEEILTAYTKATSVADESAESRARTAANAEYRKWEAGLMLDPVFRELQKKAAKGDEAAAAKIEQLKTAERQKIYANANIQATKTASSGVRGEVDTKNPLLGS
jgi:hypothetical protein